MPAHGKPIAQKVSSIKGKESADRQFVTALARGLQILRCFGEAGPELGTMDIARMTGLAQPTVWRLCHTLSKLGFLMPSREGDKLRIGLPALGLGYAALANQPIAELAKPYMARLLDRHEGAISLGVREGSSVLYVQRLQRAVSIGNLQVGSRISLIGTASGWIWFCEMSEAERREFLRALDAADRKRWKTLEPQYEVAVKNYRTTGCMVVSGLIHPMFNSVAVPLRDRQNVLRFSLAFGGVAGTYDSDLVLPRIGNELKELAELIQPAFSAVAQMPVNSASAGRKTQRP